MQEKTIADIRKHAEMEYPRESCGVVVNVGGKERYLPCRNIAEGSLEFVVHHEDYANAEDQGEIMFIVHSHPNIAPLPSPADLVGIEQTGLPWVIVNWPTGAINIVEPSGYEAPLINRQFAHGVLDCFTLVRDYFKRELQIDIPDFPRADDWWLKGQNLYADNFEKAGFVDVTGQALQTHDCFLMQIASPKVVNHAAVYVGDGMILHHLMNRLSSKDMYGGYYQKCTVKTVRHRSLHHA